MSIADAEAVKTDADTCQLLPVLDKDERQKLIMDMLAVYAINASGDWNKEHNNQFKLDKRVKKQWLYFLSIIMIYTFYQPPAVFMVKNAVYY